MQGLLRWESNVRQWITRRERVQALALSMPGLVLYGLFWAQDAIAPLTASGLMADRGLQVISLLILPAVVLVLVAKPPMAGRAAILLSFSATLMGVSLFATAVVQGPTDWIVAVGAGVAAVFGSIPLFKLGRRDPLLRTTTAKVAAALLAAAVSLAQFWNGAAFLPSRVEASFQEELTFETIADDDGGANTIVDLVATNDTSARLLVLTSRMTICWWSDDEQPIYDVDELWGRSNCEEQYPLNDLSWIPPESTLSWSTTVNTPPGDHRLVAISRVRFARGDRLRVEKPASSSGRLGDCEKVRVFAIEDESRLKGLAQQDKHLLYADDDGDGRFVMQFQVGDEPTCPAENDTQLEEYFGVTDFTERLETRIEDPAPASEPAGD
jgi:hypothetical protein